MVFHISVDPGKLGVSDGFSREERILMITIRIRFVSSLFIWIGFLTFWATWQSILTSFLLHSDYLQIFILKIWYTSWNEFCLNFVKEVNASGILVCNNYRQVHEFGWDCEVSFKSLIVAFTLLLSICDQFAYLKCSYQH